jgi:geranylgeranyl diphosphate synthase type II
VSPEKTESAMLKPVADIQRVIEAALLSHLPQCRHPGAKGLDNALHYAVFPGGKRIRPILSILGAKVFGADPRLALPAACGVEFTHTSSLIFDDLPCMDDAQIRRGIPVLHRVFGEEVALLAGIALLNQSYAIFGQTPELIAEATRCIGVDGMVAGQALDLLSQDGDGEPLDEWQKKLAERNRKTSAMMRLALTAGALACGTEPAEVAPLGAAGQSIGEAYQIADDLVDARKSRNCADKTPGQNGRHRRLTHGTTGQQASLDQINGLIEHARHSLHEAYGPSRVAELMACVDPIFAAFGQRKRMAP